MTDPAHRVRRPQLRDRVIVGVTRAATRGLFSSVQVIGPPPPPGPTILAVSHLNGFVDPVVLISRLGHLPRFLAKATLWSNSAAKYGLNFARVIPVHRAVDGATDANTAMFASGVDALAQQGTIAVFAEGTTHDDPRIQQLRTGVARLALQTAGSGLQGVTVVPIGITYEDKVALRGRALIHYGEPIEVPPAPDLVQADGSPSHEKVRAFTDHLQRHIEALTPHFTTVEEALALTAAAEINRRTSSRPISRPGTDDLESAPGRRDADHAVSIVPMAEIAADARLLSKAEPDVRDRLVSLVARYRMLCGFVGLDDATIVTGIDVSALTRRVVVLAVLVALLSPIAVAGLFSNLIPLLLVAVVGLVPKAPVTKGTVRVLVALVTFPAMWLTLALADAGTGAVGNLARTVTLPVNTLVGPLASDRSGALPALVVLVAVPVMGVISMVVISRALALVSAVLTWRTFLDRRGQLATVRTSRDEVVAVTAECLAEKTQSTS